MRSEFRCVLETRLADMSINPVPITLPTHEQQSQGSREPYNILDPTPFPSVTGFIDGAGKFVSLIPERPRYPHFNTWNTGVPPSVPRAEAVSQRQLRQPRQSELRPPPGLTACPTNPPYGQDASMDVSFHHDFSQQQAEVVPQLQQRIGNPDRTFRPMNAVVGRGEPQPYAGSSSAQQMALVPWKQVDPREKVAMGFSANYQGNIFLEKNRSADIPDDQNCSIFILGLPPMVTYRQFFAAIRNTGRVYQTRISAPEPDKGHTTSACKVVFFDRPSAERFWENHRRGFVIRDYPMFEGRLRWNRVKSAAVEGSPDQSRVLLISGPDQVVNEHFLTQFFQSKLEYQVDEIITRNPGGIFGRSEVEFRFGSFRCQAEAAKMALHREFTDHGVHVRYGPDPCDVVEPVENDNRQAVLGVPVANAMLGNQGNAMLGASQSAAFYGAPQASAMSGVPQEQIHQAHMLYNWRNN